MLTRFNNWLSKLVGPNSAHMIDAGLMVAIASGVALCASPWARATADHHSLLSVLFSVGVLVGTPLISKFRKAAGKPSTDLVAQLAQLVDEALATHDAKSAKVIQDAVAAATSAASTDTKTT